MLPLVVFITLGLSWLTWRFARNFFVRSPLDNIPGPVSTSWFGGNLATLFDRQAWDFLNKLGTEYNSVVRLTGLFGSRMLYIYDPVALHHVTIKEAEAYDKPKWLFDSITMALGPGLFSVHGKQDIFIIKRATLTRSESPFLGTTHRKQRKMLNPVFSIKHMRGLTPVFYGIAHRLCSGLESQLGSQTIATINIHDWLGRTALELIGQGGLGTSLDSLEKPIPNQYGDALKELLPSLFALGEWIPLMTYAKSLGPSWFRNAMAEAVPVPTINRMKKLITAVETQSSRILEEKKAALKAGNTKVVEQIGEGKDIMSLLLRANMEASGEDGLSDEELLGQMITLVLAGSDSTSNALCKAIEVLTHHKEVQDKLRAEIIEAQEQYGNDIPYDALVALPYLDAFCRETMRIYPPVVQTMREAQRDIIMPLSQPVIGIDGSVIKEIPVPAGTNIVVGIMASNLNKSVWGDDVLEFKPERWLSTLPASVTESHIPGVYSNLMTFHGGQRSCIGFKFSQLEMKIILATLIPKYKFSPSKDAQRIVWNIAAVAYPTVGKESSDPDFPVVMERIRV